ncbi:MAG TPA: hypothetical protein VN903_33805 [Polyangia bacterium]|nr:hypothetical protein [Polyangia bacterium]
MQRPRTVSLCILIVLGLAACGGGGGVPKAQAYCHDLLQVGCVRAFECVPPADRNGDFTTMYRGSVEQCQATPDRCVDYPAQCPTFDPDAAGTCVASFMNDTCAQLLFIQNGSPTIGLPTECAAVCPQ